jgi:molybdopterin-guanine dinucleotide biosynthesis protein B
MTETQDTGDPQLDTLIGRLDHANTDLVLVEGFRHVPFPRIELYRRSPGHEWLRPQDPCIIAVATDEPVDTGSRPRLDINDVKAVAGFVLAWLEKQTGTAASA